MKNTEFSITGMSCAACSSFVEKTVNSLDFVENATVNLLKNSMTVTFDDEKITEEDIINAVKNIGYGAEIKCKEFKKFEKTKNPYLKKLISSFVFMIPLFYISMGHMFGFPLPHILHDIKINGIMFNLYLKY